MKVVMVKAGKFAESEIIEEGLKNLQSAVGGYIEMRVPFNDSACIICNEEGKINGLEPNRALRRRDNGKVYDVICGNFIICGLDENGLTSLSEEQEEKYKAMFYRPERFLFANGEIIAF